MRERGILLALLAGMGAVTYHSSSSTGGSSSGEVRTVETAAEEPHSSESELAKTFSRFDKRRTFDIRAGSTGSCAVSPHPRVPPVHSGPLAFDWAIAVVPDPERSNLRLDFDREIEAIQLAAENAGYQFERYWFPWRTEPRRPGDSSYVLRAALKTPTAANNTMLVSPEEDNRERLPGVLLFRNGQKTPLALFLVSESPTGGIAPEEFRTAVCLGQRLANLGRSHDDGNLRLIGPALSGSLAPLSVLIRSQQPPFTRLTIRTWTNDHFSHNLFRESLAKSCALDFRPLEVDSIPAIARFVHHVRETWHDHTPIVLLTEEATAFGAASDSKDNPAIYRRNYYDAMDPRKYSGVMDPSKYSDVIEPRKYDDATGSETYEDATDDNEIDAFLTQETVFKVPFPRNLQQLRNATEKQDHLPGFGDDSQRSEPPHNGLLMSLKQESAATLEVPTFSREQTPLSQESVLFTIGSVLKTGVVHYVGILASDPLDTLFLTRYLRSASPNVRVFTANPDLLFEHGSDSSDYSGMIGLSTYPLFPLSQVWSGTVQRTTYMFPSDRAESAYNATLAILYSTPHSPIHDSDWAGIDRRDRMDPFTRSTGAFWITVAGHSGFEPIAIVDDPQPKQPDAEDAVPPLPEQLDAGHVDSHVPKQLFPVQYWPGWGYAFSLILLLSAGFCYLILFARVQGGRIFALFSAELDDYDRQPGNDSLPRAFYLMLIGMSLTALTSIWIVVPGVVLQWNAAGRRPSLLPALGGMLAAAGALVVLALLHSLARTSPSTSSQKFATVGALILVGGLLGLSIPALWRLPDQGPTYVISHFCMFLIAGCFCIGATLTAAILPFWKSMQVEMEKAGRSWVKRLAKAPYAWGAIAVSFLTVALMAFGAYTVLVRHSEDFLASYRSLDLTNGVSPIVPVTLLFTASILFAFVHLRRMSYFEERRPELPKMPCDPFCPKLHDIALEINGRIHGFHKHILYLPALALLIVLGWTCLTGSSQTLEQRPMELLIMCAALAVGFFIALVWIRLVLVWSAFSEFLQQLERHPIRRVFSLLPRGFMWSPVWQGGGKKRTHVAITRSLECMKALLNHPQTPLTLKIAIQKELAPDTPGSLNASVKDLLDASAARRKLARSKYRQLEESLAGLAQKALEYLKDYKWIRGDYELRSELATKEETKDALHTLRPEYDMEEPATICGEFVAFRFLAYINFVLWQIDNLVTCLSIGFLLLVLALNFYAFRSRTILDWMLVLLFAILTTGIVIVFAQADRDAVLSRITGTEEGKLDRNFFTHLISYGGIPALVLLSTHFPVIGRFFFSWVKPALEAIH